MTRYIRYRKDGTREVVEWNGMGEPVWFEGEPAWHLWFALAWWFVLLPIVVAVLIWAIAHS